MPSKFRLDSWISSILIILSIFLYKVGKGYPDKVALYPLILLVSIILLSFAVSVESIVKNRHKRQVKIFNFKNKLFSVILIYVAIVVYAAAVGIFGYLLPSLAFIVAVMLFFGEHSISKIMLILLSFSVFAYGVFTLFLKIPLPMLPQF